jgi:putative CocE/NonD family hydrolase
VEFGPEAYLDGNLSESYLQFRADWFDAVLGKSGGKVFPTVSYFLMGGGSGRRDDAGRLVHGGRWAQDVSWPPSLASHSPMYLGAEGTLDVSPASNPAALRYTFDPANPVPTIGGQVTSGEPVMVGGAFDQVTSSNVFGAEKPYLPLSARPDVLVFRSAALAEPVAVAGPVSADLYVSTDAPDTDFTIKLIDEYPPSADYPNGFAMNLTEGILRLRFRDSFRDPSRVEPGRVYKVRVEAPDTANLFAKGHRIRLDVSSSNFPRFDVNPNTGNPPALERRKRCAENSLHISAAQTSVLNIHVLPPGPRKSHSHRGN